MYLYSSIGYSMQRSSLPHLGKRAMTAQAAIVQFNLLHTFTSDTANNGILREMNKFTHLNLVPSKELPGVLTDCYRAVIWLAETIISLVEVMMSLVEVMSLLAAAVTIPLVELVLSLAGGSSYVR